MSLPVHWVPSLAGARRRRPVEVEGDEAHHAVAVRRLRVGEQVVLTDGPARTVTGPWPRPASASGRHRRRGRRRSPRPTPSFTVVQALPKGDRGELAVEVLTEVGVATDRAVGGRALGRGLEGRARATSRWPGGARRPARRPSRRAGRGSPRSTSWPPPTTSWRLVAAADLAVVLHEAATTAAGGRRACPRRGVGARRGRARGRADRRRGGGVRARPARASYAWARGAAHVDRRRRGGRRAAGPHPALGLSGGRSGRWSVAVVDGSVGSVRRTPTTGVRRPFAEPR